MQQPAAGGLYPVAMTSRVLLLVLSCLLASTGVARAAADWPSLLPVPSVASHLDGSIRDVLVLAVNDGAAAAEALKGALQASGAVRTVTLSRVTEPPGRTDDRALLPGARGFAVDTIVVVRRVLSDGGEVGIFAWYDKGGETIGGFTVQEGQPLQVHKAKRGAAAQGVSEDAASAVSGVFRDRRDARAQQGDAPSGGVGMPIPPLPRQAVREYQARRLGVYGYTPASDTGYGLLWSGQPYVGWPGNAISSYDLLDRVDPERAKEARRGRAIRAGMATAGSLVGVAGLSTLIASAFVKVDCASSDPACDRLLESHRTPYYAAGGALMAGGVLVGLLALAVKLPLPSADEAAKLADAYNERLRKKLGVTVEEVAAAPAPGGVVITVGGAYY